MQNTLQLRFGLMGDMFVSFTTHDTSQGQVLLYVKKAYRLIYKFLQSMSRTTNVVVSEDLGLIDLGSLSAPSSRIRASPSRI